eukprot:248160_1
MTPVWCISKIVGFSLKKNRRKQKNMGHSPSCGACVVAPKISLDTQGRYTTEKAPKETQDSGSDGYDTDSSDSSESSSSSSVSSSSSSSYSSSSSTNSTYSNDEKRPEPAKAAIPSNPQPFIDSLRIDVHSRPATKLHIPYQSPNTRQYKEPYTPESMAPSDTLSVLSPAMASPTTHHYRNDSLNLYQKRQQVISPHYAYDNQRVSYPSHASRAQMKARSMSAHNLQPLIQLKPLDNIPNLVNRSSLTGKHSSSMSNMNTQHRDKDKKPRILTKKSLDAWSIDQMNSEQDAMEKELLFLKEFENQDMDSEQQAMQNELEYLKEFTNMNHIAISPMAADYV